MGKLTAHDFKPTGFISVTDQPNFEHVKSKFVPPEKVEKKLPEAVAKLYAKEKTRRRWPAAWILKVKHKERQAYAIVSRMNRSTNEVRVIDKHGKTITRVKQTTFDSLDD